ncbi:hypothetical protein AAHA92_31875 [Salvia divinorum]|uniref:Uncharacterized protein n=1 Tax=Salvia divinorum TaxID=28513 RepID=A0ABD1FIW1_SALDI
MAPSSSHLIPSFDPLLLPLACLTIAVSSTVAQIKLRYILKITLLYMYEQIKHDPFPPSTPFYYPLVCLAVAASSIFLAVHVPLVHLTPIQAKLGSHSYLELKSLHRVFLELGS